MPISLGEGDWDLTLRPDLGGSIATLRHRGRDILRPTRDDADDVLATACFPLVPYANRIAHGCFAFGGKEIRLPRNFGDHPHSLHGVGWRSAWEVEQLDTDHALLSHSHAANADWPWDYHARQSFRLAADRVEVGLELVNRSQAPMPAGLGLHPYFVAGPDSRLRFSSLWLWQCDEDQLPTRRDDPARLADWEAGASCRQLRLIDHCYTGWRGNAVLSAPAGEIILAARGAHSIHVHIPPGESIVALEPVTQVPDAVNRPESATETGLRILDPGQWLSLSMSITVLQDRFQQG